MTLAAGEERALAKIEGALRRSDPKLAAMLSTFNRLMRSEEMPRQELLSAPRRLRGLSTRAAGWVAPTPPTRPTSPDTLTPPTSPKPLMSRTFRTPGSSRRYGHYRRRPRVAAIVPLALAMCALGLMIVLFSALSHVRPSGATPGPATTCHYVMLTGCQSARATTQKH